MGGRGVVPKHPGQRTRGGSGAANMGFRTVEVPKLDLLPELPSDDLLQDGEEWHPAVIRWWNCWRDSPLSQDMPATDVFNLEIIAVLRQEFMKTRRHLVAAELRQREAAFGATPADRMRLRILTADADVKDEKRPTKPAQTAEQKYGHLRSVKTKTG